MCEPDYARTPFPAPHTVPLILPPWDFKAMLVGTAMREAGASSLQLVSTHGTGTPLGDPIESGALRKAAAPPTILSPKWTPAM